MIEEVSSTETKNIKVPTNEHNQKLELFPRREKGTLSPSAEIPSNFTVIRNLLDPESNLRYVQSQHPSTISADHTAGFSLKLAQENWKSESPSFKLGQSRPQAESNGSNKLTRKNLQNSRSTFTNQFEQQGESYLNLTTLLQETERQKKAGNIGILKGHQPLRSQHLLKETITSGKAFYRRDKKSGLSIEKLDFDSQPVTDRNKGLSVETVRLAPTKQEPKSNATLSNLPNNLPNRRNSTAVLEDVTITESHFHKMFIPARLRKLAEETPSAHPPFRVGLTPTRSLNVSLTSLARAKESKRETPFEENQHIKLLDNEIDTYQKALVKRNNQASSSFNPVKTSFMWATQMNEKLISRVNFLGISNLEIKEGDHAKSHLQKSQQNMGQTKAFLSQTNQQNYQEYLQKGLRSIEEEREKLIVDIIHLDANPLHRNSKANKKAFQPKLSQTESLQKLVPGQKRNRSESLPHNPSAEVVDSRSRLPINKSLEPKLRQSLNPSPKQSLQLNTQIPMLNLSSTISNVTASHKKLPKKFLINPLPKISFPKKESIYCEW